MSDLTDFLLARIAEDVEAVRRPWRSRVWFYRPTLYWYGWATLRPFWFAGDEFNWHTLVIGWNLTGQVVIATRPCDGTGKCANDIDGIDITREMIVATDWPLDIYGHDHSNGPCSCDTCEDDAA